MEKTNGNQVKIDLCVCILSKNLTPVIWTFNTSNGLQLSSNITTYTIL